MKRDKWHPTAYSFLCSDHFKDSDYKTGKRLKSKLNPDAVPSLFQFPPHLCQKTQVRRRLDYKKSSVVDEVGNLPT